MYLVDVNVLVYALHPGLPQHARSRAWLDRRLGGHAQTVAFPWPVLLGFLRLTTNKTIFPGAIGIAEAWRQAQQWIDAPAAWTPVPGPRHRPILAGLIEATQPTGKQLADLHLAAMAIENGLTVASADATFGRMAGVRWVDPLN